MLLATLLFLVSSFAASCHDAAPPAARSSPKSGNPFGTSEQWSTFWRLKDDDRLPSKIQWDPSIPATRVPVLDEVVLRVHHFFKHGDATLVFVIPSPALYFVPDPDSAVLTILVPVDSCTAMISYTYVNGLIGYHIFDGLGLRIFGVAGKDDLPVEECEIVRVARTVFKAKAFGKMICSLDAPRRMGVKMAVCSACWAVKHPRYSVEAVVEDWSFGTAEGILIKSMTGDTAWSVKIFASNESLTLLYPDGRFIEIA